MFSYMFCCDLSFACVIFSEGSVVSGRIVNVNRAVTYAKRKAGIFKKAREIAILCDVKVSLIIDSGSGKMNAIYCPDNL